ncbi:MAG: GNAT family N-acetyltransferase [Sulfitobacter sp.]
MQRVLDATELFPSDMLPDMLGPFLAGDTSEELWLTYVQDGTPKGLCYARAEALTEGTWNMLAIAVHPDLQGQGAGTALTQALEAQLKAKSQRILIVDTSGTEDFAATRAFYAGNNYTEEARIRDFWAEGDDKVIFRKAL